MSVEMNAKQREFILLRADGLSYDKIASQLKTTKSTLIQWSKLFEDEIKDIQFEAFKGAAGEGFAVEYNAFLELYKLLPTISEIFANPLKADVPTEPSQLYAICGAIAGKVNDINADNAFAYINRLPADMQVSCVSDIAIKTPKVMQTRASMEWQSKTGNDILG